MKITLFSGEFTNLKLSDGEGKATNEYTVKRVGQKMTGQFNLVRILIRLK